MKVDWFVLSGLGCFVIGLFIISRLKNSLGWLFFIWVAIVLLLKSTYKDDTKEVISG